MAETTFGTAGARICRMGTDTKKAKITFSFDDNRMSTYANAFPILRENGLKGCIAVVTDRVGEADHYYGWNEIQAMVDAGWEVLAHSRTHDMWNMDAAKIRREVVECKEILAAKGHPPKIWVSPGGPWYEKKGHNLGPGSDYEKAVLANYKGSLLHGGNSGHPVRLPADPHDLSRFGCECYDIEIYNKPLGAILEEIDKAARQGDWCHLGWHDVAGKHVETFKAAAARARKHLDEGVMEPVTMSEALGLEDPA